MEIVRKPALLLAGLGLLCGISAYQSAVSKAVFTKAADEDAIASWDFALLGKDSWDDTTSNYTSSFDSNGYHFVNVNNNNGNWSKIALGGKGSGSSMFSSSSPVDTEVGKIVIEMETFSNNKSFTLNSVDVYTSDTYPTKFTGDNLINSKISQTISSDDFDLADRKIEIKAPEEGWAANLYYQFKFNWSNSSSSKSYRCEVNKVLFYEPAPTVEVDSVQVEDLNVWVGYQEQAVGNVLPGNASETDLTWSVLDSGIASIDFKTGIVTGISKGTTTIRATASNGVFGEAVVTVSEIPTYDVLPLEILPDSFDPYDSQIGNVRNELTLDNGLEIAHIANYSSYKIGNEQYDEIQLYKGVGYIENIVALPNIVAIELEAVPNESSTFNEPIVTVGTSLEGNGDVAIAGANKGYTYRYDMPEGYSYFKIAAHSSTSTFFVSMTVYVESMIDTYSEFFLLEDMCDENGIVPPNTESWSSLQSAFEELGELDKIAFRNAIADQSEDASNISQCVARYDYIVGKYTSELYADFMNRDPRAPASAYYGNDRNSAIDSTAIVFASLGVLAIGSGLGYFFYKKHKQA